MKIKELFEAINAKCEIENEIAENYGEATEEQLDLLAEIGNFTADEMSQLCEWHRQKLADAADCKQRSQYWARKQKSAENTAEFVSNAILQVLQKSGEKKAVYGNFECKLKSSFRVLVEQDAVESLPDEFKRVKTTVEADKKAIGDFIKGGGEIDGCQRVEVQSVKID